MNHRKGHNLTINTLYSGELKRRNRQKQKDIFSYFKAVAETTSPMNSAYQKKKRKEKKERKNVIW